MQIKGKRGSGGIYNIKYKDKEFNFPSVTTIISKFRDPYLEELQKEIGDDDFKKISLNAANRGSVMHNFLENYTKAYSKFKDKDKSLLYSQKKTPREFKDFDSSIIEKGRNLFYNLYHSEFLEEMHKPLLIEGLMVSFKYKYAGRVDLIYLDNTKQIILSDFKSSSKYIDITSNKIIKFKLQLAAYINAFEEIYNKTIECGVIWVSYPGGIQKIILTKFEYQIYLNFFLNLIKINK